MMMMDEISDYQEELEQILSIVQSSFDHLEKLKTESEISKVNILS